MGMLEEEVKDELMDTDVPSEGENCQCTLYMYLTIILQNHAEYGLILSRQGCSLRWLKSDNIHVLKIFKRIIVLLQQITNKTLFAVAKTVVLQCKYLLLN